MTTHNSDFRFELGVAKQLCELIDSPRSLAVYLMLKYKCWDEYLGLSIDASLYEDHQRFADDYLVTEILSKSKHIPTGIDRKQVAIDAFYASERQCRKTNNRLLYGKKTKWFSSFRENVYRILGPLREHDLQFIEENFAFGPGATTGVRGTGSVLSDKFEKQIDLTDELIPFYKTVLGERWWKHQPHTNIVQGSKFTTVPKNAKTDRGICIEPTLNIFVQKGIGALLKSRLKRRGVDLSKQSVNQNLAARAYSEGLATIDLSAASDSVSSVLVLQALPDRWFHLLYLARSPFTQIDDKWVELQKFSSMGNGYTFELETLLFLALIYTFVPEREHHLCTVYGDDIIIPQQYCNDVIDALNYLGFNVNRKKSFLAGNFFESCGSDWFRGHNVRPFYLRKEDGKIPYGVRVANQLRLYAMRIYDFNYQCDPRFKPLWLSLVSDLPMVWRNCKVPLRLGDAGIVVSLDEVSLNRHPQYEHQYRTQFMKAQPVKRRKTSFGLMLAMLSRTNGAFDSPFTYGFEPRRGLLKRYWPKTRFLYWEPEVLSWG